MPLQKLDIDGNPYLGVLCKTTEDFLFISPLISRRIKRKIARTLNVNIIETTVGGSPIVGSLLCANSSGCILSNLAYDTELANLNEKIDTVILDDKLNAVGNNIVVNDYGAIVNPDHEQKSIKIFQDIFNVEVVKGTIAGLKLVGMLAVTTNKGALCHPHAKNEEIEILKSVLKVPVYIGTANYGIPIVGACILATTKGAVVGPLTTTVEISRIEDALDLL